MKPGESEKSLGDEATFTGASKRRSGNASLGGDRTLGRGDVAGIETVFDDVEVVDLEARYRIEGTLGQGGMGAVLLATDTRLNRKVAIKRILSEAARSKTTVMRFLTEAKAIAAINHPNVVQIYDYGRAKDGPFFTMEFVDGGSLLDRCRDGGLPLEYAIDLACQLCDGLAKAHDLGIIHRDIKPANVLLTKDGIPKLTDFGLAKAQTNDHGQTMMGAVLGTPDFMPPEQRRDAGDVDARSDLWSLAATVYQVITGRSPKVIRLQELPQAVQPILAKALEDRKDDRYQSARDLRDALKTTLRAASLAGGDLDEGKCPACGVQNATSRKFCRGCGESLLAPCLRCAESMPLWDEICGSCGAKQTSLVEERRQAMATRQAEAEGLLGDFDFDRATAIAMHLRDEAHPRLRQLSDWAAIFLDRIETSRAEQTRQAVEAVVEAGKHEAAHDYASAVLALESIPASLRKRVLPGAHEPADTMLQRIKGTQAEVRRLESLVKQQLATQSVDKLLPLVEKLLALRPDREDIKRLHSQLLDREQKLATMRDEAIAKAKALLATHDYEAALKELGGITAAAVTPEVAKLQTQLTIQIRNVQEFSLSIKESIAAKQFSSLRADVERLLQLQPERADMQALRDALLARAKTIVKVNELLGCHDYEQAVSLLDKLPAAVWADDLTLLRLKSSSLAMRVKQLGHDIWQAVSAKEHAGLIAKVDYYLRLKPTDAKILRLRDSLESQEKRAAQELLEQAKSLRQVCRFDEAAALLDNIPGAYRTKDSDELFFWCLQASHEREQALRALQTAKKGRYGHAIRQTAGYRATIAALEIADDEFTTLRMQIQRLHARQERMRRLLYQAAIVLVLCSGFGTMMFVSSRRASEIERLLSQREWVRVLELDPQHVPAIVGLARSKLFAAPPDIEGALADLKRAEEIAPLSTITKAAMATTLLELAKAKFAKVPSDEFEACRTLDLAAQKGASSAAVQAVRAEAAAANINNALLKLAATPPDTETVAVALDRAERLDASSVNGNANLQLALLGLAKTQFSSAPPNVQGALRTLRFATRSGVAEADVQAVRAEAAMELVMRAKSKLASTPSDVEGAFGELSDAERVDPSSSATIRTETAAALICLARARAGYQPPDANGGPQDLDFATKLSTDSPEGTVMRNEAAAVIAGLALSKLTTNPPDIEGALAELKRVKRISSSSPVIKFITTYTAESLLDLARADLSAGPPEAAGAWEILNLAVQLDPQSPRVAAVQEQATSMFDNLSGLPSLTADEASFLAQRQDSFLTLNSLTAISADTARALVRFGGSSLRLNGLTTLSAEAAAALGEFKGHTRFLYLDGLTSLSVDAAEALASSNGSLSLRGLTFLSTDVAEALAKSKGNGLYLDGMARLDATTATALATFKGNELSLNGLTTLSAEVAAALATFKGDLWLKGLMSVSPEVARVLLEFKGSLSIGGCAEISPEVAKAVAKSEARALSLGGLETLSPETARILAEYKGTLDLDGLSEISIEAARTLARSEARALSLGGLKTLSPETARILSQYKGTVYLYGSSVSEEAAAALRENPKIELPAQFRQ